MQEENTLTFRGSPRKMEALVQLSDELIRAPASVALKSEGLMAQAVPIEPSVFVIPVAKGIVRIKLGVSRMLRPGSYQGTVRLGDKELPFVAEVEPTIHLTASPRSLKFEAAPGTAAHAELTLVNTGNVRCEIRSVYAFGLFRIGGVDDALAATYWSSGDDGSRWIDRFGENLNDANGGLVRVRVEQGAGWIEPGDAQTLTLRLNMPSKLMAGRAYSGILPIYNLSYYIEVNVPQAVGQSNQSTMAEG